MTKVVVSGPADRDIDNHFLYLFPRSPSAAERLLRAIDKTFDDIGRMPRIGRSCGFINQRFSEIRIWPVSGFEKYAVFYKVTEQQTTIFRVLHAARDLETILEDEIGGESTEKDSV